MGWAVIPTRQTRRCPAHAVLHCSPFPFFYWFGGPAAFDIDKRVKALRDGL